MNIEFNWGTWALGGIVPGLVGLVLLPLLLLKLVKPQLNDGSAAREQAQNELNQLGNKLSSKEWIMFGALLLMVGLWATSPLHGMKSTLVALGGVVLLLITGVQKWNDIIKNSAAWDTMIWLGGLLTMANLLKEHKVIDWFTSTVGEHLGHFNPFWMILVLALIYFFSMYVFSMFTAHISAMVTPFLSVCLLAQGYEMLAVALLAYFSCLCGSLTNYSSGPIVIYFGLGWVNSGKWFSSGFIVALFHLAVWLGVGLLWWKFLGVVLIKTILTFVLNLNLQKWESSNCTDNYSHYK